MHEQHPQIQMSQDFSMQQEDEVCAAGELMVCSEHLGDDGCEIRYGIEVDLQHLLVMF